MYFCALLQGPLQEITTLYPDVKISSVSRRRHSKFQKSAFVGRSVLVPARDYRTKSTLNINFQKCEWFQRDTAECRSAPPLRNTWCKLLHGRDKDFRSLHRYRPSGAKLAHQENGEKHKCLFRRLALMGPSNLSLAILRRCTIPRHDYHLRVHRPEATTLLAQSFENQVSAVLEKWCGGRCKGLEACSASTEIRWLGIDFIDFEAEALL